MIANFEKKKYNFKSNALRISDKNANLPRIKCFPVDESGVVVIADVVALFRLSCTDLGDEVSVHDYIC